MISLVALLSVAGLAHLSVRGSLGAAGHDRFQLTALYAAESGVAAGMDYLRKHVDLQSYWSELVTPHNEAPVAPAGIAGNGTAPGQAGNLFAEEIGAWYEVTVRNNAGDPGLGDGVDADARVVLRAVGHGPRGATAIIEVEVAADAAGLIGGRPCVRYGQRGIAEDGAGRNDCLDDIDASNVAVFRPGG